MGGPQVNSRIFGFDNLENNIREIGTSEARVK